MARKIVQKTNFLGGEAGPLLEGRSDLAQFQLGKSPGENFVVLKGGSDTRRPGTRYVAGTLDNKPARLIPFVTKIDDPTQIFVLEITLASSTSLAFRLISAEGTAQSISGSPVTVASTINLDEIQYTQSAGVIFLTHRSFSPLLIHNPIGVTWVVTNYIAFSTNSRSQWFSTPYRDINITGITLTASASTVGTGRTITASADFFNSGHVGAYFKHVESATTGYFRVTAFTSSTQVTAEILVALGGTSGSATWYEGSWSTYRGFPRTVTFYNQRLIFGGCTNQPDTFWLSEVADYFAMWSDNATSLISDSGIDEPLVFTLNSLQLNQIMWMNGGKKLTIGTSSSEWVGTVTNDGTNLFVQFEEETTHGSAPVQPFRNSYAIPFVQRSGREIREMQFNFDADAYEATDLNIFGSHVAAQTGEFVDTPNTRIIQMAIQKSPLTIMWFLDSAGRLYGLTRDKQQQIAAWHSHSVGGAHSDRADGKSIVKSICVIPDFHGTVDKLWLCVAREIDGVEKFHVEFMDSFKSQPTINPYNGFVEETLGGVIFQYDDCTSHLDCVSVDFESPATTNFNNDNFHMFAGDEAYFIAMDNTDADGGGGNIVFAGLLDVDAGGSITLPVPAKTVVGGLHADAVLRLLHIEGGDAPQINMHSAKSADSVAIRMHETWGLRIGKNRIPRKTGNEENETFEPIPFDDTTPVGQPTFTGTKVVTVPNDDETDCSFALAMKEPWPCTILSLSTRVNSNEV